MGGQASVQNSSHFKSSHWQQGQLAFLMLLIGFVPFASLVRRWPGLFFFRLRSGSWGHSISAVCFDLWCMRPEHCVDCVRVRLAPNLI